MEHNNNKKIINANGVFDNGFLCGKSLYLYCFQTIPSAHYIGNIDGKKAYTAVKEKFGQLIKSEHVYRYYDNKKKQYNFNDTFIVLENGCLLEFDTYYCEIYHNGTQDDFINEYTLLMQTFKERQRKEPLEINLISSSKNGLELKQVEIKRTRLKLDLFYEDDFKEVDSTICKRLSNNKDKGIVLLHGLPGTGKTTYLRYLIGKLKKRILFVSSGLASDIMSPDFIRLLVNNPNSILIIEDAENVIMDRKISNNASVSNLLNISDGLLADFLNIQIICTFNSPLTLIDSALLRKGRLIAQYEFGKLSVAKAQKLSNHFKYNKTIEQPMTIAEITNQHEKEYASKKIEVVGFRRETTLMN